MRRGRNADARSSRDAATEVTSETANAEVTNDTTGAIAPPESTDNPPAVESAETAEAAPEKRRRTSSRRKTAEVETPASEPAVPEPEPIPEPVVAETPAEKPRRTTRRRTAVQKAASEELPVTTTEPEQTPEPEVVPEPPVEITTETAATPAPTRARRSRRTAKATAEPEPATAGPESSEPEVVMAIPAPIETTLVEVEPDLTTESVVPSEVSEEGTGVTPPTPVPTAPSGQQRTRGLRRTATPPATPTITQTTVLPAPITDVPAEAPAQRRTRGLRRTTQPKVLGTAPTVVVPTTPTVTAEPVPPLYQPLSATVLANLPEGLVRRVKNLPELVINGEARSPAWFFVNTEDAEGLDVAVRQIRMAYEAGIRFFTLLAHLPWKGRSGERRFEPLEETLKLVAENAPEAFIMPRLIFSPPASWVKANDADMTRYQDSEQGDISFASRAFWEEEAVAALRAAVEYVAQGPHAGRVFGFYLEHGEWFYEKGRGYDYSEVNQQGFRAWLKTKYRGNAVALRAAWYDGAANFDTAAIPPSPPPDGSTLFLSPREQRWADYHEYASDIVAEVILRLGKTVKESSGKRSLVAVSYGYTMELARAGSGHLALGKVLASEYVDILTGPLSYSARLPGGSAPLPVPLDSIHLAGKLYISEDDTKTFLANEDDTPDAYNPKISDPEGTWSAHCRNFGAALTRGAGISWMDLWGMGWLNDREIWGSLGRLRRLSEGIIARNQDPEKAPAPEPDVAVIVDERAFFDVRTDESLLGRLITQQRDTLLRSGARIGFYLLSDLTKPEFPTTPRLLLFLNAFRLPEAVRAAIRERFQDEGRTLAWLYGPGCREENLSELTDVIGMHLRLQPWGSKMGTTVLSNTRSPMVEFLRGQKIGEDTRANPTFYVADTKAETLGEYSNGNPSIAYRKHARWQSVFIGETTLSLLLLRGLYRLAGVPVYTSDDDVTWVGDKLICMHSAPGGGTNLYLPEEAVIYDLLAQETLAGLGYGARLSMPPRGTRLLFVGTPDEVRGLGGDPNAGPLGLTREELPAPTASFVFEGPAGSRLPDVSPEDVDLMEAALSGTIPLPDKDEGEEEEGEEEEGEAAGDAADPGSASGKKKRRRRRRGRGRSGEEIGTTEEGTSEESAEDREEAAFAVAEAEPDDSQAMLADAEAAIIAPPGPRRPSLEELLPLSEMPDESELPPIPDEFLPLDPLALASPEVPVEEEGTSRRRRPRRERSRRERSAPVVESSKETPGLFAEETATESSELATNSSESTVESAVSENEVSVSAGSASESTNAEPSEPEQDITERDASTASSDTSASDSAETN